MWTYDFENMIESHTSYPDRPMRVIDGKVYSLPYPGRKGPNDGYLMLDLDVQKAYQEYLTEIRNK